MDRQHQRQCAEKLTAIAANHLCLLLLGRAQKMKPWMLEMAAADGTKLHGAGLQYSEGWWKVSRLRGGHLAGCKSLPV